VTREAAMSAAGWHVTPEELRWVGYTLSVGYALLAGASYLDFSSRQRGNQ